MKDEWAGTWKAAVLICFKTLDLYLPVDTEKKVPHPYGESKPDHPAHTARRGRQVITPSYSSGSGFRCWRGDYPGRWFHGFTQSLQANAEVVP
jgi:hypothetical protein